jgi:hypothetical protein
MPESKEGWVDFKEVKAQVTLPMLLDRYRIKLIQVALSDEWRGKCPLCSSSDARCFAVNTTKQGFKCHACNARGNVLDLVAKRENCNIREAAVKLAEWFSVGKAATVEPLPQEQEEPVAATPMPSPDRETLHAFAVLNAPAELLNATDKLIEALQEFRKRLVEFELR